MLFFFNDTATTSIFTLSLHYSLPISGAAKAPRRWGEDARRGPGHAQPPAPAEAARGPAGRPCPLSASWAQRPDARHWLLRSEEHTSELKSRQYIVCRLLLEKIKSHSF